MKKRGCGEAPLHRDPVHQGEGFVVKPPCTGVGGSRPKEDGSELASRGHARLT